MSTNSQEVAKRARADLHETLTLLGERLDYPARVDAAVAQGKRKITRAQRRNPIAFAAGVVGVSLVAGAAVAVVVLAVTNRVQN